MAISVNELKRRCLELVREVEATGKPVAITRRGRVVAQLGPAAPARTTGHGRPWERMRGRGKWLAGPGETFIRAKDLKAALTFPPTRVDEVFGSAGYRGPALSLTQMNAAVAAEAKKHRRR